MTTKTDPGSGAPEPTARSADLTPDDDRRPVDALPSIIVDPSAFAAVAAQREDERDAGSLQTHGETADAAPEPHAAAPAPNGTSHEHEHRIGDDEQPDPEDRFSVEEAERFAEHFRPSWEPLPPTPEAPVRQKARVVVVTPDPAEVLDSVLPRRQRRRALIMVGIAVCSFVALTALAMMSASHDAPPDRDTEAPDPPAAAPAAAPSASPTPALAAPARPDPAIAAPAPAPAAPAQPDPAVNAAAVAPTAVPADQPGPLPANPTAAAPTDLVAPSSAAAEPAPAGAVPAATGIQAIAAAVAPEAAPAQATTVRIQLKTVPTSATLLIDGTSVANPFDVVVEKSGKHRVQAQAPGYRESDFTLSFDRPRDLSLRLQKMRVVRKQAARRAAAARAPVADREPAKFNVRPAPEPTAEPPKPAPVAPKPAKGAGFVSESPY